MLTCHPGNRHGEAARAEGCVEGRYRASIFCRVSSHCSRDFDGLPSSPNVQEVPAKATMKQPVEVLAKCHVNQAARPHKRQKMMYGRHSHCESFSSQGSELEGMQPQGEGAGQGTGPCRAPASEVDAGAMPYFYRRQGRRLPRPLHDRPIVRGHVMEDKLLKSIRDMEVLKAEMPSKIISDYKESLGCKMGLQGTKQGTQVYLDSTLLKKVKVLPQIFLGGLLFKVVNPKGGVDHLSR
ncbi:hypothetical protein GW17_00059334 [Ensete ventricosum]|nr:hypothetical protein GW17_00059334 [Ensete ventricosum]